MSVKALEDYDQFLKQAKDLFRRVANEAPFSEQMKREWFQEVQSEINRRCSDLEVTGLSDEI
jgi:hypothetical protein